LAEIVLVVQLGEQVLIFVLKEELGLFLLFDSFFSLNEMKIFLIASLEDGVLKSNGSIIVELVFLKFVIVVHVELSEEKFT
jgi:hypothetical protein